MSGQQTTNLPNFKRATQYADVAPNLELHNLKITGEIDYPDLNGTSGVSLKANYVPKVFNENAEANVAAYMSAYRAASLPGMKGEFAHVSNAVTGETVEYFDGVRNPAGQPFNKDTHLGWFSITKASMGPLVIAKCLEERWFNLADAASLYLPEWTAAGFGATGVFVDNVTSLSIPTYPYPTASSSGGWTGAFNLVPFALSDIKISHLMSHQLGISYDFEMVGGWLPSTALTGTFAAPIGASNYVTGSSKPNIAVHYLNMNDCNLVEGFNGFTTLYKTIRQYGGDSPQFRAVNDFGLISYNILKLTAQRKMWFAFRPGTASMYSYSLELLGSIINKLAIQKGYTGLWDFFSQKFLQKMNIPRDDLWFAGAGMEQPPAAYYANHFVATFNRAINPALNLAIYNIGVSAVDPYKDPSYPMVQGTNVPVGQGPVVWASDYKYDDLSIGYYACNNFNSTGAVPIYSGTLGGGIMGKVSAVAKLFELLANRGTYKGQRLVSEWALRFLDNNGVPFITNPTTTGVPITTVNTVIYGLLANAENDNQTWKANQAVGWSRELFSINAAPTTAASTNNNPNSLYPLQTIQFPFTADSYQWAGANRTRCAYDTETKMVSMAGSQMWVASTYSLTNGPDGLNILAANICEASKII